MKRLLANLSKFALQYNWKAYAYTKNQKKMIFVEDIPLCH